MKLGLILRTFGENEKELVERLHISRVVQNFSTAKHPITLFGKKPTLHIPHNVLAADFAGKYGDIPFEQYESVMVDVGRMRTELAQAARIFEAASRRNHELTFGLMANQAILLEKAGEMSDLFRSAKYYPVSILGDGQTSVRALLDFLKDALPFAVPCVLSLDPLSKATLGQLLLQEWNNFDELLFWSPITLAGVDVSAVTEALQPVFEAESQRYIALKETHIRVSPGLGAKTLGTTRPGDAYRIVEFTTGLPIFGKLENGNWVVFDETYFQKETY